MLKKEVTILTLHCIIALLADAVFFSFTNPLRSPSLLIVVGFVLLYMTLFTMLRLLLTVLRGWLPLGQARVRRIAMLVSGLLIALLAMQSIGQLTVKDLAALTPIIVVLYFYVSYNSRHSARDR